MNDTMCQWWEYELQIEDNKPKSSKIQTNCTILTHNSGTFYFHEFHALSIWNTCSQNKSIFSYLSFNPLIPSAQTDFFYFFWANLSYISFHSLCHFFSEAFHDLPHQINSSLLFDPIPLKKKQKSEVYLTYNIVLVSRV